MSILGASRRDDPACCSVCGAFGPAVEGSPDVETNGRGALHMGHHGAYAACCNAPAPVPWTARVGARTVLIHHEPAVALTHAELHAGKTGALVVASTNVLVGGASISMEDLARADALAMIDKGLASLDRWNEQDRAAFKEWYGTDSEEARRLVRGHLLLMRDKLSRVDFAVGDKNQWAHVFPLGNTVHLDNWFWRSPRFGEDSRSGTVVHETSHFLEAAGTRDVVYGRKACRALAAKDPDKALNNADSHEYWLETLP